MTLAPRDLPELLPPLREARRHDRHRGTEADEFFEIYKLGVVEVPTNMPVIRKDHDDQVFRTAREKYEAIVEEIKRAHEAGQPILVGTTSIEKSESLSEMLKKAKRPAQRAERPLPRAGGRRSSPRPASPAP